MAHNVIDDFPGSKQIDNIKTAHPRSFGFGLGEIIDRTVWVNIYIKL